MRWAWPLAARAAEDLGDAEVVGELLALLDSYPSGHLPAIFRAERDPARARIAARAATRPRISLRRRSVAC
jgi:hypothetical protein